MADQEKDRKSTTGQAAPAGPAPAQDQPLQEDDSTEERLNTGTDVRADEPDEKRIGEAGSLYMGRGASDRIKNEPRPEDEEDLLRDE
jgi:hypothetical protein